MEMEHGSVILHQKDNPPSKNNEVETPIGALWPGIDCFSPNNSLSFFLHFFLPSFLLSLPALPSLRSLPPLGTRGVSTDVHSRCRN